MVSDSMTLSPMETGSSGRGADGRGLIDEAS